MSDKIKPSWQERVITERNALGEKIDLLSFFADEDNPVFLDLDIHVQTLLLEQLEVMMDYLEILDERISLFDR